MTRRWTITERIIGVLEFIWGALLLCVTIWGMKTLWDFGVKYIDNFNLDSVSFFKLIINYHYPILIAVMTMYSGISLLMSQRAGWIISLLTSFLNGVVIIIKFTLVERSESLKLLFLLPVVFLSIICFAIFVLLLNKQFREKYKPTKYTWTTIVVLATILLADSLLLN